MRKEVFSYFVEIALIRYGKWRTACKNHIEKKSPQGLRKPCTDEKEKNNQMGIFAKSYMRMASLYMTKYANI